jgi:hypothetical protein
MKFIFITSKHYSLNVLSIKFQVLNKVWIFVVLLLTIQKSDAQHNSTNQVEEYVQLTPRAQVAGIYLPNTIDLIRIYRVNYENGNKIDSLAITMYPPFNDTIRDILVNIQKIPNHFVRSDSYIQYVIIVNDNLKSSFISAPNNLIDSFLK